MERNKQKALEKAGFRVGDAEDFLDLDKDERSIVELRVAVARTVRRLREKLQLSQQELASKIQSSQSRVAKIEAAAKGVSLDLSFRGLFAVGGRIADLAAMSRKISSGSSPIRRKQNGRVTATRVQTPKSKHARIS